MKRVFNKKHACANDKCQLDKKNGNYNPLKCPKIMKIAEMLSPEKREQYLEDVQKFADQLMNESQ